jgi:CheY-like chemotaxis protein
MLVLDKLEVDQPDQPRPSTPVAGDVSTGGNWRASVPDPFECRTGRDSAGVSAITRGRDAPGRAQGLECPGARRRVVMVVDDDDAIREALDDVLSDEGYEVIGACDGQQALEYLNADDLRGERRPQAILIDLWMPIMDGWKLVDLLSADGRFSRIPVVVLTAARDQRARELCVSEVLTKPVQLHQVLGVLGRLTAASSS